MTAPLTFGLFPLGMAGGPDGLAVGPPDDFDAIGRAAGELQGDGPPLLPRMYVVWSGAASTEGIDLYPGVFGPRVAVADLPATVEWLLRDFRENDLATAGIPASVPIRICENGWPTGSGRSEEEQAAALETIIRTVHRLRAELNVTHWELFTLRDADSSQDDLFHRFGVLRSDYTPKPAFHALRRLIAELG